MYSRQQDPWNSLTRVVRQGEVNAQRSIEVRFGKASQSDVHKKYGLLVFALC